MYDTKMNSKLSVWVIVLLALGSPIWLSLLIAAFAVVFSLYVTLWSLVISFWAVLGSLVTCAFGGMVSGIVIAALANTLSGIAMIGAGTVCVGVSVFTFFACRAATNGMILLTKNIFLHLKARLFKSAPKNEGNIYKGEIS